jgi:transcriptional regulator with XRE-family HTH domain
MPELSRLDGVMNRRRVELRLTWRQLATRAGVSYETLRAIRKGESAGGELSKANIEQALLWGQGSIASVEAGGDPLPLQEAAEHPAPTAAEEVDPRSEAIMTILADLPPRVQADVMRRLGDRLPAALRDEVEAKWRGQRAG